MPIVIAHGYVDVDVDEVAVREEAYGRALASVKRRAALDEGIVRCHRRLPPKVVDSTEIAGEKLLRFAVEALIELPAGARSAEVLRTGVGETLQECDKGIAGYPEALASANSMRDVLRRLHAQAECNALEFAIEIIDRWGSDAALALRGTIEQTLAAFPPEREKELN